MGSIFHSAQEMQHKIDSANDVIENMKMDYENASSIRIYFLKTQNMRDKQDEFDTFLDLIAPSYKLMVQNEIFKLCLQQNCVIREYFVLLEKKRICNLFIDD